MADGFHEALFQEIQFVNCPAHRKHLDGSLDVVLRMVNQTAAQKFETKQKLWNDIRNGLVPQSIPVGNPDEERKMKMTAAVGYFTSLGCYATRTDDWDWVVPAVPQNLAIRKKEARISYRGNRKDGRLIVPSYNVGYMQFYPEATKKRKWKVDKYGEPLPMPCQHAGLNVATLLLHIRKELRDSLSQEEFSGLNLQVRDMLNATRDSDNDSMNTVCMHSCHTKGCLKMSCLKKGTVKENIHVWMDRLGRRRQAREARAAHAREARAQQRQPQE